VDVWNGGNPDQLDAIMDPHVVRRVNFLPDVEGVEEVKKVVSEFRTAYPDLKIVMDDGVYSENASSGRWTLTGTNTGPGAMPPTRKAVKIWGITILHYANGRITEEWVGYDSQSLMEQLGYTITRPSGSKQKRNSLTDQRKHFLFKQTEG
jgi:predicted ester cyclase